MKKFTMEIVLLSIAIICMILAVLCFQKSNAENHWVNSDQITQEDKELFNFDSEMAEYISDHNKTIIDGLSKPKIVE